MPHRPPRSHLHKEGMRARFELTCVRVSTYEKTLLGGDLVRLVWRYQFHDVHGFKYVYSGSRLAHIRTGVALSLYATVKHAKDSYGYCRLSRPRVESIGLGSPPLL